MTRALVLELVEGPTLADRISTGSIPPDDGPERRVWHSAEHSRTLHVTWKIEGQVRKNSLQVDGSIRTRS